MTESGFDLSLAQTQRLGAFPESEVPRVQLTIVTGTDDGVATYEPRFADLCARYEVLRTAFVTPVGLSRPLQTTANLANVCQAVAGDVDEVRRIELAAPLDLGSGLTVRLAVGAGFLILTAAAAVADEKSLRLIAAELLGGDPAEDEPLQFVDYAAWEAEQVADDGSDARIARAYWTGLLGADQAENTSTPTLEVRPERVADDTTMSPGAWLAAWAVVLTRHSDPDDEALLVSVAVDGRVDDDVANAIGPYERYVPLLVPHTHQATFAEVTARVEADWSAASRFSLGAPATVTAAAFSYRPDDHLSTSGSAFPLELVLAGDVASLWYAPTEVGADEASMLADELRSLLASARQAPASPATDLEVLGAEERAILTRALTGDELPTQPFSTVIEALAAQVVRRPDAVAVAHGERRVTFAELDDQSRAIALAVGSDRHPVAFLLEPSADAVAVALGILRSGAAYLALDPSHPPGRWSEQLAISEIRTVVTSRQLAAALPEATPTMLLDDVYATGKPGSVVRNAGAPAMAVSGQSTDPAYLIFTSGSTGRPKAVAVTHGNVLAYTAGVSARLALDSSQRFATVTSMATDLGNTAIFGALLNGGTLEIVTAEAIGDGPALEALVRDHTITALKITPSHLRALLSADDVHLPLQLLVVGGESLDSQLVRQAQRSGVRRVVNHYGPTETTVGVFTHDVAETDTEPIPIGRPLPGVRAQVRDASGVLTPLGAVGELWIGGASVAAGYLGSPEEDATAFAADPERPGARVYRTGDRVRVRRDGLVEFLGRSDSQVKIRGFRVELGEIEARLRSEAAVAEAVVAVVDDVLAAYVVSSGTPIDAASVQERLAERLPPYMIPATIVVLAELPRTSSGKLDRRRLASLRADEPTGARGREPEGETERDLLAIWRQILPAAEFGVEDNFFRIGGHSLLATRVVARARSHFRIELPLHTIFASPTVADMAKEIDRRGSVPDDALADMLAELDQLSDDEAIRLLRSESSGPADDA